MGILLAQSQSANREELQSFARQLSRHVKEEMESTTGIKWMFHQTDPVVLENDSPHRPSGFLDDASLRMGEGPYDALLVITNVALLSRLKRTETGLASSVSRVMVISPESLLLPEEVSLFGHFPL